jgi:hypothetical protein
VSDRARPGLADRYGAKQVASVAKVAASNAASACSADTSTDVVAATAATAAAALAAAAAAAAFARRFQVVTSAAAATATALALYPDPVVTQQLNCPLHSAGFRSAVKFYQVVTTWWTLLVSAWKIRDVSSHPPENCIRPGEKCKKLRYLQYADQQQSLHGMPDFSPFARCYFVVFRVDDDRGSTPLNYEYHSFQGRELELG